MCTVTIIPKGNNDFVLTSNRDEAPNRVSLSPEFYSIEGVKTLFPKDELSDGTWIGVSDKNRLICVLNGGFVIHERKAEYRKSRGLVAKDVLIAEDLLDLIKAYDLEDIEPFTMVIADWNTDVKFFELVWDGIDKHISELPLEPKLWSSSTLYNEDMKAERQQWFKDFKINNELNAHTLMQFHSQAGGDNTDYGVIMDRHFVKTTSITQVEKHGDDLEMSYENLQDGTIANKTISLPQKVNE
ncbi:NRDE family protein [Seonamhaeicola maritimus]|uniref:NRDE family protein n=1 Tax=Seonamhaeicola maritimus TaxID=2591822 RepID=A0A5C7GJZ9_9FLAO|nr:NRDE family protein [Seonamhaeicola maritimus]TXG38698.1 NRDE family protein [Seonamhaeicola maritimus]